MRTTVLSLVAKAAPLLRVIRRYKLQRRLSLLAKGLLSGRKAMLKFDKTLMGVSPFIQVAMEPLGFTLGERVGSNGTWKPRTE